MQLPLELQSTGMQRWVSWDGQIYFACEVCGREARAMNRPDQFVWIYPNNGPTRSNRSVCAREIPVAVTRSTKCARVHREEAAPWVPSPHSKGGGDGVTSARECFSLKILAREFALRTVKLMTQAKAVITRSFSTMVLPR
jgi:hypothetical protein